VGRDMKTAGCVRMLLSVAMLLVTAACVPDRNMSLWVPGLGPGHLALSNFRFDHASIEAVLSAAPDCSPVDPNAPPLAFELPFKGTRVIQADPDTDICWRRQVPGGPWGEWNRAFTASGRSIDLEL
jgi:hypothetical protein